MIRTLLVDDEPFAVENLRTIIQKFDENIHIIGAAHDFDDACEWILKEKPDLIFLDIEMPGGNGLDLLERLKPLETEVIIVTAYDQFALKALKNNALDYILKPINKIELLQAIEKAKVKIKQKQHDTIDPNKDQKIALPTSDGLIFVLYQDIVYLESDTKYTYFHLKTNKKIMVSKNLGEYETILPSDKFIRIHHKHIVNIAYITRYIKGRGGYVILENGGHLDVSDRKKENLLGLFRK